MDKNIVKHPVVYFTVGVLKKTPNIYSGISLILIVLSFFTIFPDKYKTAIQIFSCIFAFFFSAYFFWKEAYNKLPQKNELSFTPKNILLGATSWSYGFPRNPTFQFDIDIQNRNLEKYTLADISILGYELNTEVLELIQNHLSLLQINPQTAIRTQRIRLPLDIEERDHKLVRFEISANFINSDIETLKSFLQNDIEFKFVFKIMYTDFENNGNEYELTISNKYDGFKKELLRFLREYKRRDILDKLE